MQQPVSRQCGWRGMGADANGALAIGLVVVVRNSCGYEPYDQRTSADVLPRARKQFDHFRALLPLQAEDRLRRRQSVEGSDDLIALW